mgnify:FL=1
MNIICTPTGVIDSNYSKQGISDIAKSGFENMLLDFRLVCSPYELENPKQVKKNLKNKILISQEPSALKKAIEPLTQICKTQNLHTKVAYAPHFPRNTKQTELNETFQTLTKESIKVAAENGCEYIIIRPLFFGMEKGKEWEVNKTFYLSLAMIAKENNIMILLENQCKDMDGHLIRGICSDAYETASWIDELNLESAKMFEENATKANLENMFYKELQEPQQTITPQFGFCMDCGVCTLCGQDMYDFVKTLGTRIKAVMIRDCDGHTETSMLPFTCVNYGQSQTDWLSLIRGLRELGFDGELILNFSDTAASFSPILRPQLMSLAKSVADYFKWQIEIENLLKKYSSIVLFGAGNMCRNYMKCYGEKYPPLFTCDNNAALWETTFCGLEVKSPQELKTLSSDCAIFICNVYYREIEQQIREMGIKNKVEYFNDEYMPSFYYDRI